MRSIFSGVKSKYQVLTAKVKPKHGFGYILHLALVLLLPLSIYVMLQLNLPLSIPLALIILSKWRIFAVRPRHWAANIRTSSVDIIINISFLIFMEQAAPGTWRSLFTVLYAGWLIFLKPGSSLFKVSLQAIAAQTLGLIALFLALPDASLLVLITLTWLIAYAVTRHFLSSFDEPYARMFAYAWAYFSACLVWVLGHWLLFYGLIAQPMLLLSTLAFGLGTLYYLNETDRLSTLVRRQIILVMISIIVIVIAFSDWGDKAV